MKKIISVLICFLMIFNIFPVKTFAEEQNLEEIIRPQVEAFAKSIDQKNADGAAQDALISHGIKGNGKKLSVGKSHALTATLMNSELVKEYLTVVCSELVNATKELEKKDLYGLGNVTWKIKTDSYYFCVFYDYNISLKDLENEDPHTDFKRIEKKSFKPKNSYDKTLEVIAGGTGTEIGRAHV